MRANRFSHFVAIDWSGARGERHKGIAVASCDLAGGPPVLIERDRHWSRSEVLRLISDELNANTLVGMDLGISLPFADCGAFFPGCQQSPQTARDLWRLVDEICQQDPHFSAQSFVEHPHFSEYFRHTAYTGQMFRCDNAAHGKGRFRVTETAQASMGCKPYSNFNLVGAAQVGKSSLTGMRVLGRLPQGICVWPIDPLPDSGPVVTEIYTALAALEAGRSAARSKIRSLGELNAALAVLGSEPVTATGAIDDHRSDALITAAWLRKAASEPHRWAPQGLTAKIAATEGWTFGAF